MTKGEEGVKNDEKSSDVICERPLTQKHTTSSLAKTSIEEEQNTTVFAQKLLKAAKS